MQYNIIQCPLWSKIFSKYAKNLSSRSIQISGIALIVIGTMVEIQFVSYHMENLVATGAISAVLIVAGILLIFLSIFGCCGSVKENYTMLMIVSPKIFSIFLKFFLFIKFFLFLKSKIFQFASVLTIIFLLEVGGAIAAFVLKEDVSLESRNKI